jgi:hypothetical protein
MTDYGTGAGSDLTPSLRPSPLCPLVHPLGLAVDWAPYHLRDFRTLFDELLHGFRLERLRSLEADDESRSTEVNPSVACQSPRAPPS